MNAIFSNLTTQGLEETEDRLGGGFRVLDSGSYEATIKAAYAGKSSTSNAQSVTLIAQTEDGTEYRETFWVTNRNQENFYLDKNDKTKKIPLPGFTVVDDLCLVTTNKPLAEQAGEEKVINVYDPEAKKELPKAVPMLVDLIGKKVYLGIIKELRNKQAKNAAGNYEDTADEREENVVDKIFHYPSKLTVVEARKQIQTPTFYNAWVEKNSGQVRDRRTIKDGASAGRAGRPGTPPKAGDAATKTSSLFG